MSRKRRRGGRAKKAAGGPAETAAPPQEVPQSDDGEPAQDERDPHGRQDDDAVVDGAVRTRGLRHPLWIHPSVRDALAPHAGVARRVGLLAEQLAARGRCSVVKTCRGSNRGWRRSPLGGAGGCQYYLWWTTAGTDQGRRCGLPPSGIAIRAARHHDDHAVLKPGRPGDYVTVDTAAEMAERIPESPWTEEQRQFRDSTASVRVLEGQPGSGKTTALWHSVDARKDDHVLYLTWSSALAEDAAAHFESFAAPSVKTTCIDYATLMNEITGIGPVRIPLRDSRERFKTRLADLKTRPAGPWAREPEALHAELRSMLLGGATSPEAASTTVQDGCLRLTEAGYRHRRAQRGRIDKPSIAALLRTADMLPEGTFRAVFPELHAAHAALVRLADADGVPEAYLDVDRIVVDEAQDLTLTETTVIARLCRRIGERAGLTPRLLIAGDEGQTVRPTGFSWARTRELLDLEVGRPATYTLSGQVRCPPAISELAEGLENYYQTVVKELRPRGQHTVPAGGAGDGRVLRVDMETGEIAHLIDELTAMPSAAVISATAETPDWLPDALRRQVLTPTEAKGLEYQTACVVDLGEACATAEIGWTDESDNSLDHEVRRSAIDQARVAVTRATDTLVLLDLRNHHRFLLNVGGEVVHYSGTDVIDMLRHDDATPEERAMALADECRALREENIDRALMRAQQALELLGEPNEMGRVADRAIRTEVGDAVLGTICTGIVDQDWNEREQTTAIRLGIRALATNAEADEDETATCEELLAGLASWKRGTPSGGLTAVDRLALLRRNGSHGAWAETPMRRHRTMLLAAIEDTAADSTYAKAYRVPDAIRWLKAIAIPDPTRGAIVLARAAFDTLLAKHPRRGGGNAAEVTLNAAGEILATLPRDAFREARIEEADGRTGDALRLYRKAGAGPDVDRMVSEHALWDESEGVSETRRGDQTWLLGIERAVESCPADIGARLSNQDRTRVKEALKSLSGLTAGPEQRRHGRNRAGPGRARARQA